MKFVVGDKVQTHLDGNKNVYTIKTVGHISFQLLELTGMWWDYKNFEKVIDVSNLLKEDFL